MKILVTGGTGYIGSHTVVELFNAGYEVVIVDDLSNSDVKILDQIEKIIGKKPAFVKLDLCEEKEVIAALNNMERLTNRLNDLSLALDKLMAENIKLKQEIHALKIALEHERMQHQQVLKKYESTISTN